MSHSVVTVLPIIAFERGDAVSLPWNAWYTNGVIFSSDHIKIDHSVVSPAVWAVAATFLIN